ncbi:DegT/DnrJ/EryC1/StrS family aminotransferase [Shigella flexneri]
MTNLWPGTAGRSACARIEDNLTDINAAIALVQLNGAGNTRAQIAQQYQQALADRHFNRWTCRWPHVHAWHLFIIRVDEIRCGAVEMP